jgi:hypothetical protein
LLEAFIRSSEFDHVGDKKLDLALLIITRKSFEEVFDRFGFPFQNS